MREDVLGGKAFAEWPPMMTLGRSGDEALAGRFASALAAELVPFRATIEADVASIMTAHILRLQIPPVEPPVANRTQDG